MANYTRSTTRTRAYQAGRTNARANTRNPGSIRRDNVTQIRTRNWAFWTVVALGMLIALAVILPAVVNAFEAFEALTDALSGVEDPAPGG